MLGVKSTCNNFHIIHLLKLLHTYIKILETFVYVANPAQRWTVEVNTTHEG